MTLPIRKGYFDFTIPLNHYRAASVYCLVSQLHLSEVVELVQFVGYINRGARV